MAPIFLAIYYIEAVAYGGIGYPGRVWLELYNLGECPTVEV